MCHHELWPTSESQPSSFLNSSLCLAGRALVDKGICVPTCRLALNVMTCRYVLSLNKCNLYRCYSSCRKGNLYVDMSFIPKCHDILTHLLHLFFKILLFQVTFLIFFSITIFSLYFLQVGLLLHYVALFQSGN